MPYSISVTKLRQRKPAGDFIVTHKQFLEDDDDIEHTRESYNCYSVVAIAHPSYNKNAILGIIMVTGNGQYVTWALFDWSEIEESVDFRNMTTYSESMCTDLDTAVDNLKTRLNNTLKTAIRIANGEFKTVKSDFAKNKSL